MLCSKKEIARFKEFCATAVDACENFVNDRFTNWLMTGIVVLLIVFLAHAAFAQDSNVGWCNVKPGTPQSVIDYFKKFNQPIPQQYCDGDTGQEQAQEQAPTEEAPPPPAYDGPPAANSQTPVCGYWNNFCGQEAPVPGGVYINLPWLQLSVPFYRRRY
jgi:hypothetical protein